MSISLPSDLVLDVARAADPARAAKASAALNAGVIEGKTGSTDKDRNTASFASVLSQQSGTVTGRPVDQPISAKAKAAKELETLLLQQMVESLLPKGDQSVFGKGTAGSVWRSMLAEHVARSMASSGEVDLSKVLARRLSESDGSI